MKDIYKVGMTTRNPSQRLMEANQADTWRPPTPYVAVLTRKVANVRVKETTIHEILSDLGYRIHPRREFFNAPLTLIEKLFSLTDGEPGNVDIDSDSDGDGEDVIEHVDGDKPEEESMGTLIIKQHEDEIKNIKLEVIRTFLCNFRDKNPAIHKIQAADLYSHYCTWCDETGAMLESLTQFGRLLSLEKSCPKVRTGKGYMIYVNPHRKLVTGNTGEINTDTGGDDGDSPVEE